MPTIYQPDPIILYTVDELSLLFPEKYQKALEDFRTNENMEYQINEAGASLEALTSLLGLKMRDYRISLHYSTPYVRFFENTILELKGIRAFKYIENALSEVDMNPWIPLSKCNFKEFERRKQAYGKPWKLKDCPLTGIYYDDDLIRVLKDRVLTGYTIGSAMHYVICHLRELLENEYDSITSDQGFKEYCIDNDVLFTSEGSTHHD